MDKEEIIRKLERIKSQVVLFNVAEAYREINDLLKELIGE